MNPNQPKISIFVMPRRHAHMKLSIVALLFFTFPMLVQSKPTIQHFDKKVFFSVMKSGNPDEVNEELNLLNTSAASEKDGYEGALMMQKAGLLKIPAERLKLFKKGRIKLETAIYNDRDNTEYRFLRLIIQEHAPKIVKYKTDLETDKEHIKKNFRDLALSVQEAIRDYSKNSKVLSPQDF